MCGMRNFIKKIIKYSIYNNSDMIHNSKISKLKDFKYFNMVYSLI